MNLLTLENVTKTYGEKVLFQNIDLQISQGQKELKLVKPAQEKKSKEVKPVVQEINEISSVK